MKVIIILLIAIFFLILCETVKVERFSNNTNVPKILWAYWDSDDIPEIVKLCQKNWKRLAPNYQINLVNKEKAKQLVELPDYWEYLKPYRQSDIFRLKVLEKYGGVWMDASSFLMNNPDNFVSPNDITLFTTPASKEENPVFENWFIASPPNHPTIKKWISETLKAVEDPEKYINDSPQYNIDAVQNPTYLICHLALKNIYENDKNSLKNAKIHDCNETAFYQHKLNSWQNLGQTLFNGFVFNPDRLFVKLRGSDRRNMDINNIPHNLL